MTEGTMLPKTLGCAGPLVRWVRRPAAPAHLRTLWRVFRSSARRAGATIGPMPGLLAVVLLVLALQAPQTATLTGKVFDRTGGILPGVSVTLEAPLPSTPIVVV